MLELSLNQGRGRVPELLVRQVLFGMLRRSAYSTGDEEASVDRHGRPKADGRAMR